MTEPDAGSVPVGVLTNGLGAGVLALQTVRDLPRPRREGGLSVNAALNLRHSTREYSERPLDSQTLSDLLWAAFGVNRPNGDRTAPYWRRIMIVDLYAAMADGVWLYDPNRNALLPHLHEDIRGQTGQQAFVATAPLNLIYVAHGERLADTSSEERWLYASVDTGFIGQNVYLFCAAHGLATIFHGSVDRPNLARAMRLPAEQFVTFTQTVGYERASPRDCTRPKAT